MGSSALPALVAVVVHLMGAAAFAGVFWFLQREWKMIYFGYWALAWALLGSALLFNVAWLVTGRRLFLAPYGLLELAFVLSLVFAGASVLGRSEIRISSAALLIPALALAAYGTGLLTGFQLFYGLHSLLLTAVYAWNFFAFRQRWRPAKSSGSKLFSMCLLASSLFYSHYTLLYALGHVSPWAGVPPYLRYHDLFDMMLEMLLAFSAMIMWMEVQHDQLAQLNSRLSESRTEIARNARIDSLTGLLNRMALNEMCARNESVSGVVAVIDLDNFKHINDALGHLMGDEVLASVGSLIRSSVRKEDLAWRWGGDEFVLLFRDQSWESVEERLQSLQERLVRFRIRGKGVLPVNMSWGVADVGGRPLQVALEEADHQMYSKKHEKVSPSKFFGSL